MCPNCAVTTPYKTAEITHSLRVVSGRPIHPCPLCTNTDSVLCSVLRFAWTPELSSSAGRAFAWSAECPGFIGLFFWKTIFVLDLGDDARAHISLYTYTHTHSSDTWQFLFSRGSWGEWRCGRESRWCLSTRRTPCGWIGPRLCLRWSVGASTTCGMARMKLDNWDDSTYTYSWTRIMCLYYGLNTLEDYRERYIETKEKLEMGYRENFTLSELKSYSWLWI